MPKTKQIPMPQMKRIALLCKYVCYAIGQEWRTANRMRVQP